MAARRQVIVWSWSLQTGPFVGDDAQELLSDDERARQRSFVSPELRRRFGAARAGLRTLLGRHLDLDPRRLAFSTNEFGKPRLAGDGQVHFNLSHCEERAVLAISDTAEVGIDLECERPIEHVDLAKRYFHPNEVAAITASPDEAEQRRAFFLVWTLKEAVVKALGTGLSTPLELIRGRDRGVHAAARGCARGCAADLVAARGDGRRLLPCLGGPRCR